MKKNIYLRIALLMLVAAIATSGVFIGSGTTAKYVAAAKFDASARVAKFELQIAKNGDSIAATPTFGSWVTFSRSNIDEPYNLRTDSTGGTAWGAMNFALGEKIYDMTTIRQNKNNFSLSTPTTVGSSVNFNDVEDGTNNTLETGITKHLETADGSIIAPGTGGRLRLSIKNNSEVAVRVYFDSILTKVEYGNPTGPTTPAATSLSAVAGQYPITPNPTIATANLQFSTDNITWYNENQFAQMLATGSPSEASAKYIEIDPMKEWTYAAPTAGQAKGDLYWRWQFSDWDPDAASGRGAPGDQDRRDTALGVAAAIATQYQMADVQHVYLTISVRAVQVD